ISVPAATRLTLRAPRRPRERLPVPYHRSLAASGDPLQAEPMLAATDRRSGSPVALIAAVLGFFVVTLDAVIVNVALPSIRDDFRTGIAGLQWVVDGYTLLFA